MLVVQLATTAFACGGFACDNGAPVLQNAERIVFGIDPGGPGEVEMHVQISYEGPSESFAWIVPVPAEPELFVSTSDLFTRLAIATQPSFQLQNEDEGNCVDDRRSTGIPADSAGSYSTDSSFDVNITGQKAVGPYETVTLSAASSQDLVGWLETQGYDLPPGIDAVLQPYVSDGSSFVALRLAKDKDLGDLAPLGLRYHADRAVVPVQLTSISATPDLRMEAYVLSSGRGVPESYLHVRVNDAAIDWWTGGANYADVITRAADEAGGHAFATDYFGSSDVTVFWPRVTSFSLAPLRTQSDPKLWFDTLRATFPTTPPPELLEVLEDALRADGLGALLWSCPTCALDPYYGFVFPTDFDPEAATLDLEVRVVEPLQVAQALLDDHPRLARMTSSLDAAEMTVDPVFVVNEDLAGKEVLQFRSATQIFHCGIRSVREAADRTLVLEDGRRIELPSMNDLQELGMTEYEWLADHHQITAQIIEQMGETGEPEVIADFTADLLALTQGAGCGCDSRAGAAGWLALGAVPWLFRRRIRRTA